MVFLEHVAATAQSVCPRTGRALRSREYRDTTVGYILDETDRFLIVVGSDPKTQQEWPVAGGVRVHAKFVHQGKATLHIQRRSTMILISNANPDELRGWLQVLAGGRPSQPRRPPPEAGAAAAANGRRRTLGARSPGEANSGVSPPLVKQKARTPRSPATPSPQPQPQVLSPNTMRRLSDEQQEVLRAALAGRSMLFTGGAGTGKSMLLREMLSRLPAESTFATATTGVAACAIGGVTIHHWAGIGGGDRPMSELVAMARRKREKEWKAARCLVIDEVSMLDGALFDTLEEVARRVRGSTLPFGGLQIIACGDFFQLPPVTRGGVPCRFAFEASRWGECVPHKYELRQVFRQADSRFIDALTQLRVGRCPPEVKECLNGCMRRVLDESDGIIATRLFTHRADCARHNESELTKLPGEARVYAGRDTAESDEALRMLNSTCVAPAKLRLKPGMQVLLTKTINQEAGLVNGARGLLVKFLALGNPVVRFESGEELTLTVEKFPLAQAGRQIACRMQYPIDHGWAISIHRSQGMSLSRVQMSLGRCFEYGQVYVALSRARSLEGLSLTDIDYSRVRAHPKVLAFSERIDVK